MGFGFLLALFGLGAAMSYSGGSSFTQSGTDPATADLDEDDGNDELAPISEGALGQVFSETPIEPVASVADMSQNDAGDISDKPAPGAETTLPIKQGVKSGIAPGAYLTATEGEDTFVLDVFGATEAGKLLGADGKPVGHTIVDGFNPDADRLILDLGGSNFVSADGAPVVLTGVVPPDGEGLMIQVNGVNVVQLSTYGGGNAQWALEDLYTDFGALEVTGASFVFGAASGPDTPPTDPILPDDEEELERIIATGIGNDGDNLILPRDDVSVYQGLGGNDTMVGFVEFGVTLLGGEGDDVIIAFQDDIARGGAGDDLLLGEHLDRASRVQVLDGGEGDDLLISHGGSEMTGGAGEDVFTISPMGLDPVSGAFLSAGNDPLPVSVVTDFNLAEDVLVIDLAQSFAGLAETTASGALSYGDDRVAPAFGGSVVINPVEVDGGTLVTVNDMRFVLLQGITPEQFRTELSLQVVGAEFEIAPPQIEEWDFPDWFFDDEADFRPDYGGTAGDDQLVVVDAGRAYGMAGDDTLIGLKGDGAMTGPQVLDGVSGDNTIIVRSWANVVSGTGADNIVLWPYDVTAEGDWQFTDGGQAYPAPQIINFDPAMDTLALELGRAPACLVPAGVAGNPNLAASVLNPDGQVTIINDAASNSAIIEFDGRLLARLIYQSDVTPDMFLTAADIRVAA
jgi:hypothetical protein